VASEPVANSAITGHNAQQSSLVCVKSRACPQRLSGTQWRVLLAPATTLAARGAKRVHGLP
jgi:hypothetical protein